MEHVCRKDAGKAGERPRCACGRFVAYVERDRTLDVFRNMASNAIEAERRANWRLGNPRTEFEWAERLETEANMVLKARDTKEFEPWLIRAGATILAALEQAIQGRSR